MHNRHWSRLSFISLYRKWGIDSTECRATECRATEYRGTETAHCTLAKFCTHIKLCTPAKSISSFSSRHPSTERPHSVNELERSTFKIFFFDLATEQSAIFSGKTAIVTHLLMLQNIAYPFLHHREKRMLLDLSIFCLYIVVAVLYLVNGA